MIPLLGPTDPLPPVERALYEPNGLLAAGGGLSTTRLLEAYSSGIFPWFSDGDPILWWCPDPRTVLATDRVHISRSLRRRLRQGHYEVTFDRAFADVMRACAMPRKHQPGTWLLPSMQRAYQRLHDMGVAHSIEIWMDGELAGGLYGVALGRMFFGESMFTRRTDGSKMAIALLAAQLARWNVPWIDCQLRTEHLESLGATEIPRREFVRKVRELVRCPAVPTPWRPDDDLKSSFD